MKIVLGELIIDPQQEDYEIVGLGPQRIGDQCYITPDSMRLKFGEGIFIPVVQVILLADASGRQWLVICGR